VRTARKNYDVRFPLILAIYVNEFISMHVGVRKLDGLVKNHEDVFDDIAPFSEIVFYGLRVRYGLRDDGVFSVRADEDRS